MSRRALLERLLLVVVLYAVLAFTARVSAAWVACCTSYALIWLLSRLAAHAHGSHCRLWTCMVFGVACGVHVGPMAALLGAFWPLGLPKSCLWWPPKGQMDEQKQKGQMDEFERFVRANRLLLQTRHHKRPKEAGAPHIELLQNALRQTASKGEYHWYHFLTRLRGKSGWPEERAAHIWQVLWEDREGQALDAHASSTRACGGSEAFASGVGIGVETGVPLMGTGAVSEIQRGGKRGEAAGNAPPGKRVRTKSAAQPPCSESTLCLRGLNIQYPFSQLILAGVKTAEVRDYPLGHRNIVPGERMWLLETGDPECAPTKHAIIPGVDVGARPEHTHIVGVIEFSSSEPYQSVSAFRADAAAHCIQEGGRYDRDGVGGRHRWRIAVVRRLAAPVAIESTGMTGFGQRSFAVTFLSPTATGTHPEAPSLEAGSAKGQRQEGPAGSAAASSSASVQPQAADRSSAELYFEEQVGAWCGLHALNHYLGGAYVTQDACRRAAVRAVAALSQIGGGDREPMAHHLDPDTGFLSIDVINILGESVLGLHVEGSATPWAALQAEQGAAALVNWHNQHWTVLQCTPQSDIWVHTNSILGDAPRHGRTECPTGSEVATLLAEIQREVGAVTLHRIHRGASVAGSFFLEREGLRAMVGAHDVEVAGAQDGGGPGGGARDAAAQISVVTVNVDGLGEYVEPAATRLEAILDTVLAVAPDVLLLQEVVPEMYAVVRRRLPDWKVHRRGNHTEDFLTSPRCGALRRLRWRRLRPTRSLRQTTAATCSPSGAEAGPS